MEHARVSALQALLRKVTFIQLILRFASTAVPALMLALWVQSLRTPNLQDKDKKHTDSCKGVGFSFRGALLFEGDVNVPLV